MNKIVIFGANGQDGFYLQKKYELEGSNVLGVSRSGNHLNGDVASFSFVEKLIREYKPDIVFHLAANSTTNHSALIENNRTIGNGSLNVLEAVYRHQPDCKIFLVGSGLQFQNIGYPVHETDQFDPSSPYSVERIYSVYLARYYRTLGMKVYIGYLFHHESPFRKPYHISQQIVQLVKQIESTQNGTIELYDISVKKEWGFAEDIAEGMMVLVGQEKLFEAVIGTGKAHSIMDWLKICFSYVNKNWEDYVVQKRVEESPFEILVSNPSSMKLLGWEAKTDIEELASIMITNSKCSQ